MMTDCIGPVTIYKIGTFSKNDNIIVLSGFFQTRHELDGLADIFRKSPYGSALNTVIGGLQKGHDLTKDRRLTQYCMFDSDKLLDGYYLLREFHFVPDQYERHYPFRCELFFLGSKGFYKKGFETEDLDSESNDWSI